ncbi:MAG TPA: sortase [Candidatus Woesebacteria bacterium]|nr:sortase [Candidatus Woesebacteria bacterium]
MSIITDFFRVTPKTRKVKIRSKKGIIYHNPSKLRKVVFYLGTCLFLISLGYIFYLYSPLVKVVYKYETKTALLPNNIETKEFDDQEYSIIIPKISAYSNIVPNINPFKDTEYLPILKENVVAQAKGSNFPGLGPNHTTYIFAHSTDQGIDMVRKNSVFYLLGELKTNDEVQIRYQGEVHNYRVYKTEVVEASQIEYLNYKEPDKEIVILQTCWPLGTDWKRLLVFAQKI